MADIKYTPKKINIKYIPKKLNIKFENNYFYKNHIEVIYNFLEINSEIYNNSKLMRFLMKNLNRDLRLLHNSKDVKLYLNNMTNLYISKTINENNMIQVRIYNLGAYIFVDEIINIKYLLSAITCINVIDNICLYEHRKKWSLYPDCNQLCVNCGRDEWYSFSHRWKFIILNSIHIIQLEDNLIKFIKKYSNNSYPLLEIQAIDVGGTNWRDDF